MKTICASPAATAICSSMDLRSRSDRFHHQHHRQFDDIPRIRTPLIPCSPRKQPINPKPRSSTSQRRNSAANVTDLYSPPGSSRFRLSDATFHEKLLDDTDNAAALVPIKTVPRPPIRKSVSAYSSPVESPVFKASRARDGGSIELRKSVSAYSSPVESPVVKASRSQVGDKVVELRVSIHCKGCEAKVRKHLSRMEGVRSFSIDLESKKVTVTGNLTPLSVLSSVSRVKNAQFWSSPTSQSSSPSPRLPPRYTKTTSH